ncbi:MAG TPA: CocE/NonD family hydrolase [Planctomycetaceae bacterium]|nr:CocE/NonD family hydrolase [Planctomycetaceae bacterium]
MALQRRAPPNLSALVGISCVVALLPRSVAAQNAADEKRPALAELKAQYTKYEYRIPVRDGKRLFTAVYVPKDQGQTYPILLTRTPYSAKPYGADQYRETPGPSALYTKAGYIFAIQDVRGRWMSEGEFVNMRPHNPTKRGPGEIDESTDTFDTIDWLLRHVPNHNGKVGMWGISYPGFYTAAGSIDAHPALKAVSPQAPVTDWFIGDDWHHNGALILVHMFSFMSRFDRPRPAPTKKFDNPFDYGTPDGYDYFLKLGPLSDAGERFFKGEAAFWNEAMKHGTYDDFWKSRNLRPHLKDIKPAVLTVCGWYDAENLFGALEVYRNIKKNSPRTGNFLVMGPWVHGGWTGEGSNLGDVQFNAKTAEFYREQIELPFFEHHLKGKGKSEQPEAWMFETGTNVWRKYDTWPPKNARAKSYYFHTAGRLTVEPPTESEPDQGNDEYPSDPSRPVPFVEKVAVNMVKEYMTADQRFASRRPDVVVYSTDELDEDVTIAGPIEAKLFVSTTGTDADWVVKLIDVYPDDYPDPNPNPAGVRMGGYMQLVRGDVMRGKFRNSFERPEPFAPGKPTPVKFTLQDVSHTFRSGHRIMVQVQSSWFPLVDRNPQKFVDIYTAKDYDFQKATQRVYRTRDLPSSIGVMVMPQF